MKPVIPTTVGEVKMRRSVWKSTMLAVTLMFSLFHFNLSWAQPLDVDVGFSEIPEVQIALTTDDDNDKSALGEMAVDLYRVDIVLAVASDLESRINGNKENLSPISAFQKPEIGWRS